MGVVQKAVEHVKEFPAVYTAVVAVVTLLGGSMTIKLPVDEKVAAMEMEIAQTWQQREMWQQQQQEYHRQREIEEIDWQLRYISNEINRLNMIPQYLNRPLTEQEIWQIEQLKREWELLQEKRHRLGG